MSEANPHQQPITAEQFFELGLERAELVDGRVVEGGVPGELHALIQALITGALVAWALPNKAGRVLVEAGFVVDNSAGQVRIPDVSFIAADRCDEPVSGWSPIPPDIAVEVVSPTDQADALQRKVTQFLDAGVHEVWVVHPQTQTLVVWGQDTVRMLRGDASVTSPLLPGFELPLSALFSG